jgi:hypothetical protein
MAYFKSQKELRNNTKQISHNSQTIQPWNSVEYE